MKFKALTTGVVLALGSSMAQAIELTDYTDPTSNYEEAYVEGYLSTNSGNQDQTSYDLNLNLDWESVYSSLPRTWTLQGDAKADVSQGGNDGDKKQENISANLAGTIDNYFNENSLLFWFGSGELGYLDDAEDTFVKLGTGIGYGRVITATPLAKVLRIEEELREHGVLIGQLSDDTYLQLARIIDREKEYESRYGSDEYKPYFFADMEKILKATGNLKEGSLGATGALFMDRVLYDEAISARRHGWLVRGGAGLVVQDYSGESDNDPSIDLAFEYAKPYGYKAQFDNVLSYSTIFANDTDQRLRNRMRYTYELSDRIDWVNSWTLDHLNAGDAAKNDSTTNSLASTFQYYLTNKLRAAATLSLTDVEDNIDGNNNDDVDVGTYFSVSYRLK